MGVSIVDLGEVNNLNVDYSNSYTEEEFLNICAVSTVTGNLTTQFQQQKMDAWCNSKNKKEN